MYEKYLFNLVQNLDSKEWHIKVFEYNTTTGSFIKQSIACGQNDLNFSNLRYTKNLTLNQMIIECANLQTSGDFQICGNCIGSLYHT